MKFRILFFASFYFIFANFVNAQTVVCTWAGGDLGDETNWDNDANWTTTIDGAPAADAKPTNTSNVIIPNSVTNYPVVSSGTCVAANVTIDANGGSSDPSLTINGTQTLDIEGDFLMNITYSSMAELGRITDARYQASNDGELPESILNCDNPRVYIAESIRGFGG